MYFAVLLFDDFGMCIFEKLQRQHLAKLRCGNPDFAGVRARSKQFEAASGNLVYRAAAKFVTWASTSKDSLTHYSLTRLATHIKIESTIAVKVSTMVAMMMMTMMMMHLVHDDEGSVASHILNILNSR